MKTMQNFVDQLTGPELYDRIVEQLCQHIEGFQEDHSRYLAAIHRLKEALGDPVDQVISAIERRISSDLFFAGSLGLKMNWDHFVDPMTPNCTWPQVDYSDYLREDLAHSLPTYRHTEGLLSSFYHSLTAQQKEIYGAVTEYESCLLTFGPKLAHYYGYLLGNTLLYRVVPGYRPDHTLTMKYKTALENYFGCRFLPVA